MNLKRRHLVTPTAATISDASNSYPHHQCLHTSERESFLKYSMQGCRRLTLLPFALSYLILLDVVFTHSQLSGPVILELICKQIARLAENTTL